MTAITDNFWRGPIRSRSRADQIRKWAGWVSIVLGIILALFIIVVEDKDSAFGLTILFSLMEVSAIYLLLSKDIVIASTTLFSISVLYVSGWGWSILAVIVNVIVSDFHGGNPDINLMQVLAMAIMIMTGCCLVLLNWRALKASELLQGIDPGVISKYFLLPLDSSKGTTANIIRAASYGSIAFSLASAILFAEHFSRIELTSFIGDGVFFVFVVASSITLLITKRRSFAILLCFLTVVLFAFSIYRSILDWYNANILIGVLQWQPVRVLIPFEFANPALVTPFASVIWLAIVVLTWRSIKATEVLRKGVA